MTSRTVKILLNGLISGSITALVALTDAIANGVAFTDVGWFTTQTLAVAAVGGLMTALLSWKTYVTPPPA